MKITKPTNPSIDSHDLIIVIYTIIKLEFDHCWHISFSVVC
jgi:hypothetical protein